MWVGAPRLLSIFLLVHLCFVVISFLYQQTACVEGYARSPLSPRLKLQQGPLQGRRSESKLFSDKNKEFMQIFPWYPKPKEVEEVAQKDETDLLLEYVNYKPWRAPKVKYLKYHYKPWKESYQERYRNASDETIYLYTLPRYRNSFQATIPNEMWGIPFQWSKIKTERFGHLFKHFYADINAFTVQDMIEFESFFQEQDMAFRWGHLRLKELSVLNILSLTIIAFTDMHGIDPTDRGIRPDGTLRTCPVQFHNCLSSSNEPSDFEHYAPPLRYKRTKSPTQALEEIKDVFQHYPKHGLKWSSGWIDRGGWRPQLYNDHYFYAQVDSIEFQFTDDVEFLLDEKKREVQLRTTSRMGQFDCETQTRRYNQFVRMLLMKQDWEVEFLPPVNYLPLTPFRWTRLTLDKGVTDIENTANRIVATLQQKPIVDPSQLFGGNKDGANDGLARQYIQGLIDSKITPLVNEYLQPIEDKVGSIIEETIQGNQVLKTVSNTLDSARVDLDRTTHDRMVDLEKISDTLGFNKMFSSDAPKSKETITTVVAEDGISDPTEVELGLPHTPTLTRVKDFFTSGLEEATSSLNQVTKQLAAFSPTTTIEKPPTEVRRGKIQRLDRDQFRKLIQQVKTNTGSSQSSGDKLSAPSSPSAVEVVDPLEISTTVSSLFDRDEVDLIGRQFKAQILTANKVAPV